MTNRLVRAAAVLAVVSAALIPLAGSAARARPTTRHELYPVPPGKVYTLHGRGAGHGHGMSQWGAYGAAKVKHRSTDQILHFYYPHTKLVKKSVKHVIRVLITAVEGPTRGYLEVAPASGLTVDPAPGKPVLLPTRAKHHLIKAWRLQRNGNRLDLREQVRGHWHTTQAVGAKATFTDKAQKIAVQEPTGSVRFRGAMIAQIRNGALEPVNLVNLELYLRGVVPSEMPSSWSPAALRAQAIAARSYALHELAAPKAAWFDIFGDSRDQAYGGMAVEAASTNHAIDATAGRTAVTPDGHAIFAQFGSGDGGWTVAGGQSYLPAEHDPYDGLIPNSAHSWSTQVSAATLQAAYPAIGTLQALLVTGRDGNGIWGGRVTAVRLRGSAGSVTLTGSELQFGVGLQSDWFRPIPPPGAPRALTAKLSHKSVTVRWKAPHSVRGAAAVSSYRVVLTPGHRSKRVAADVRRASFGKLPRGRDTITVTARSSAGSSKPATVVVDARHQ